MTGAAMSGEQKEGDTDERSSKKESNNSCAQHMYDVLEHRKTKLHTSDPIILDRSRCATSLNWSLPHKVGR